MYNEIWNSSRRGCISSRAFLSSINSSNEIVSRMLCAPDLEVTGIADYNEVFLEWNKCQLGMPTITSSQKSRDGLLVEKRMQQMEFNSDSEKASFLVIQCSETNNVFRISVGLRLGCDICRPHTCNCGIVADSEGRHGLKCKKSTGRSTRHAELRED